MCIGVLPPEKADRAEVAAGLTGLLEGAGASRVLQPGCTGLLALLPSVVECTEEIFRANLARVQQQGKAPTAAAAAAAPVGSGVGRTGSCKRSTKETRIEAWVNLDGVGESSVATGVGFLDHMVAAFAKHGHFDVLLKCAGDLEIDDHHTAEDCALALGERGGWGVLRAAAAHTHTHTKAYRPMVHPLTTAPPTLPPPPHTPTPT